jgi:hypothetical protein
MHTGTQMCTRLFLYGTLRAMPLLAWALTGDSQKTDVMAHLVKPAELRGYKRFSLPGKARRNIDCRRFAALPSGQVPAEKA